MLASLIAAPAAAQSYNPEPARVSVGYGDLDLAHPAGQAALAHRVHMAINRVCPTVQVIDSLGQQRVAQACRESALSSAQQQIAAILSHRQLAQTSIEITEARR
jgi:UrcA family protein